MLSYCPSGEGHFLVKMVSTGRTSLKIQRQRGVSFERSTGEEIMNAHNNTSGQKIRHVYASCNYAILSSWVL